MAVGWECAGRPFELLLGLEPEAVSEPPDHVAALADGAPEHAPVTIQAVHEGAPGYGEMPLVEQHAQRPGSANGGAGPAGTAAARANVRQCPIAEG